MGVKNIVRKLCTTYRFNRTNTVFCTLKKLNMYDKPLHNEVLMFVPLLLKFTKFSQYLRNIFTVDCYYSPLQQNKVRRR